MFGVQLKYLSLNGGSHNECTRASSGTIRVYAFPDKAFMWSHKD